MPDHGPGERHQPSGNVAAHHQFAGKNEEGDRHQRENGDTRVQALEDDDGRQAHVEHGGQ